MGNNQSSDKLLYDHARNGNVEAVRALWSRGAGLEWIDGNGKTALIIASTDPHLYDVAKALIELGANVHACRPGLQGGTPLHYAAKRGLEQTVKLLLLHGANALARNGDEQTPLDLARARGFTSVVRAIEEHVCLFSSSLRELYLEPLAPPLFLHSRNAWVVIVPRNIQRSSKLELVIYASAQDAQPRTIVPLWKANLEEPNFNEPAPVVVISDSKGAQIRLAPRHESEKQELQRFYNTCKGIPQVMHPIYGQVPTAPTASPMPEDEERPTDLTAPPIPTVPSAPPIPEDMDWLRSWLESRAYSIYMGEELATSPTGLPSQDEEQATAPFAPPIPEDELAMGCSRSWPMRRSRSISEDEAVEASLQSAFHERPPLMDTYVGSAIDASMPSSNYSLEDCCDSGASTSYAAYGSEREVQEAGPSTSGLKKEENTGGRPCTICLDAVVQGACIPCGHMAGCMSCLTSMKNRNLDCPICRTHIEHVNRIYHV